KSGLTKSRESWAQKIGDMFQNRRWDEASLEAMEENLIAADVGVKATQKLMNLLRNQSPGGAEDPTQEMSSRLQQAIVQMLDPAAVVYDGLQAARGRGVDVLLIDTAGRLHTKLHLIEELKKIRRVISREQPDAPHEILLVLDATTGQNGLQQARVFKQATDIT